MSCHTHIHLEFSFGNRKLSLCLCLFTHRQQGVWCIFVLHQSGAGFDEQGLQWRGAVCSGDPPRCSRETLRIQALHPRPGPHPQQSQQWVIPRFIHPPSLSLMVELLPDAQNSVGCQEESPLAVFLLPLLHIQRKKRQSIWGGVCCGVFLWACKSVNAGSPQAFQAATLLFIGVGILLESGVK